jgi:hypothetical protein
MTEDETSARLALNKVLAEVRERWEPLLHR